MPCRIRAEFLPPSQRHIIVNRISLILWLSLITALTLPARKVSAQQMPAVNGRQFMLNQMTPPGTAAEWAAKLGRTTPEYFQPVRLSLPSSGLVTFYEGASGRYYDLPAPAQASLIVGGMYRMCVKDVPEFPGAEFYPSIELIDRLHPPVGKIEEYPVEFELTLEELEWAANGRLVTKVVYLEQPNRVPLQNLEANERITTIEPHQNVIAEADLLGRPIAIVRLGGRMPDLKQPDPVFFGPGGPIRVVQREMQTGSLQRPRSEMNKTNRQGVVRIGPGAQPRVAQR